MGIKVFGQFQNPVKWTYTVKQIENCQFELLFKAVVEKDWHLYSQTNPPYPAYFEFTKSGKYKLIGKTSEPKPKKVNDEYLGEIAYFEEHEVVFKQKIELNANEIVTISGKFSGQACRTEGDGMCVPLEEKFSFKVDPGTLKCLTSEVPETNPTDTENLVSTTDTNIKTTTVPTATFTKIIPEKLTNEAINALDKECGEPSLLDDLRSLLGIFITGFIGGFIALLMPCIFPMIPLTVSFFTKQSKSRAKGIFNALLYGLSIILIYTSLGLLITIIFGSDALNKMAVNPTANVIFFIIFIIFAASFLGAFEITLPSKFVNKVDSQSNRGGLIGLFFMAFTLCLVSFSCTGPIIGSLLVEAATGSYLGPAIGMFGFSLALALPFTLFAIFPSWLNSLPKSGGWLNSVKVILGFIEIALAFKFLSTADLVSHWDFLKRELYISIWITCAVLAGLYLLGAFKLSHDDDKKEKLSVPRITFAFLFLGFAVYMIPGLFGAPLRLLSGYLPPTQYKEWKALNESHADCPHNLECYHDFDEGVASAQQRNKPILIDFTGYGCVNCRKMEDQVWSDPGVFKMLNNDFVVISLYVDDYEKPLPANEQVKALSSDKILKSYGDKWGDMQRFYYGKNAQPQYILITPEGKLLNSDIGACSVDDYTKWLEQGLCRWNKVKK